MVVLYRLSSLLNQMELSLNRRSLTLSGKILSGKVYHLAKTLSFFLISKIFYVNVEVYIPLFLKAIFLFNITEWFCFLSNLSYQLSNLFTGEIIIYSFPSKGKYVTTQELLQTILSQKLELGSIAYHTWVHWRIP